jgi:hypothetical protein
VTYKSSLLKVTGAEPLEKPLESIAEEPVGKVGIHQVLEVNDQAVKVTQRIQMKLNGREFRGEAAPPLPVEEQVTPSSLSFSQYESYRNDIRSLPQLRCHCDPSPRAHMSLPLSEIC